MSNKSIGNTLSKIARDISGKKPLESGYARAFVAVLSKLPLYLEPGAMFVTPECEAKYLDTVSDLENLLMTYGKDKMLVQGQINTLVDWLSDLDIKSDRRRGGVSKYFKYILNTYARATHRMRANYPLHMMHCAVGIIDGIMCTVGSERGRQIKEFDKYMRNLAIVGLDGLNAIYRNNKQIAPRFAQSAKLYMASLGDPHFDITRFLLHGPYTLLFYVYGAENAFNKISSAFLKSLMDPIDYDDLGPGYKYEVNKIYGWGNLSHEERKRSAKIMFPEPATIVDMLSIPF